MASLYHPWTGEAPDKEVLGLLSGLFVCPAAKAARYVPDSLSSPSLSSFFFPFVPTQTSLSQLTLPISARQEYGSPIWRYRYFGEFPNMNPYPWLHAYHGGEVPMVLGTADTYEPNTHEQDHISAYMQRAWVAFAKDPANGLLELGWPHYVEDEDTLVRIGHDNALEIDLVKGSTYDGLCPYVMTHLGDVVKRAMPP